MKSEDREDMESETQGPDPVVLDPGGNWIFFDETWANVHGPFATEKEAREKLRIYMLQLG